MPKGIQIVPVLKLKNAPKDVQANRPIGVDVGVVDPGCEGYLQRILVDCLEQSFENENFFGLTFGGLKG